ncbi:MAG: hypothetical protein K0V04_34145 [Deltaproteobacteria bacterium]|nr:hypothetical protein [Deltaproteobacteria bacterium]
MLPLLALALPTEAAAVGTTGSMNPPGPGSSVDYSVTLASYITTDPLQTHLMLAFVFENDGDEDMLFHLCSMIRLDADPITMPQNTVEKMGDTWECTPNGTVSRPPGQHFGCTPVSVPAGGKTPVLLQETVFGGIPAEAYGAIYFDLVQAIEDDGSPCYMGASCGNVRGQNINLSPTVCDMVTNAVNIWGGCWFDAEDLVFDIPPSPAEDPHTRRVSMIEMGNWNTMETGQAFAAALVGGVQGAPPGSELFLYLPQGEPIMAYADDYGNIPIEASITIPEDPHAVMYAVLDSPEPLAEDAEVRLALDVVATEDSECYAGGQWMHGISVLAQGDVTPPEVEQFDISQAEGGLDIAVTVTDALTLPTAVALVAIDGEPEQVVPLALVTEDVPDLEGAVTFALSGFVEAPPQSEVAVRIATVDGQRNTLETEPQVVMVDAAEPNPDPDDDPDVDPEDDPDVDPDEDPEADADASDGADGCGCTTGSGWGGGVASLFALLLGAGLGRRGRARRGGRA